MVIIREDEVSLREVLTIRSHDVCVYVIENYNLHRKKITFFYSENSSDTLRRFSAYDTSVHGADDQSIDLFFGYSSLQICEGTMWRWTTTGMPRKKIVYGDSVVK